MQSDERGVRPRLWIGGGLAILTLSGFAIFAWVLSDRASVLPNAAVRFESASKASAIADPGATEAKMPRMPDHRQDPSTELNGTTQTPSSTLEGDPLDALERLDRHAPVTDRIALFRRIQESDDYDWDRVAPATFAQLRPEVISSGEASDDQIRTLVTESMATLFKFCPNPEDPVGEIVASAEAQEAPVARNAILEELASRSLASTPLRNRLRSHSIAADVYVGGMADGAP